MRRITIAATIACLALVAGCSSNDTKTGTTSGSRPAVPALRFDRLGPHAVGVTDLQIPTDAGGTRQIRVWYPAAGDAAPVAPEVFKISDLLPDQYKSLIPAASNPELPTRATLNAPGATSGGPFPIFAFNHGYGGFPTEYQHLTTAVASWGYVVVAPVFAERGLLSLLGTQGRTPIDEGKVVTDAVAAATAASNDVTSVLAGLVRPQKGYVVGGHSAGTGSTLQAANESSDVIGIVQMSGGGTFSGANASAHPKIPSLFLTGSEDGVIPLGDVTSAFKKYDDPKLLVSFERAGHLSFTDICTIGRDQGGLLAISERIGLTKLLGADGAAQLQKLAGDGCGSKWITPEETWPAQDDLTVAFLRWRFGTDKTPAALTASATKGLGGAKLTFTGGL